MGSTYTVGAVTTTTGANLDGSVAFVEFTAPADGLFWFDVLLDWLDPNGTTFISWSSTKNGAPYGSPGGENKAATADQTWERPALVIASLATGDVLRIYITSSNIYDQSYGNASCTVTARDGGWASGGTVTTAEQNVYWADIDVQDNKYTVTFYRNAVATTVTNPKIQVINRSDGSDLVNETALTQIGSSASYKYDETTNLISGIVIIVVSSDSGTFRRIIG